MDEELTRSKILALIGISLSYISLIPGFAILTAPASVICSVLAIKDPIHVTGVIRIMTYMACGISLVLMFINYTMFFSELFKSMGAA